MGKERMPPKQALLTKTMAYVSEHGVADLTLRKLAEELGTSHRMLVYHFGSKEGLFTEVVREVERRERAALDPLHAYADLPIGEQIRRSWRRFSDPKFGQQERLFFEVYGQALVGRNHATKLLEDVVEAWLTPFERIATKQGRARRAARAEGRLMVAVIRGLLLDLLATGDRSGVDDAMEVFIDAYSKRASPPRGSAMRPSEGRGKSR